MASNSEQVVFSKDQYKALKIARRLYKRNGQTVVTAEDAYIKLKTKKFLRIVGVASSMADTSDPTGMLFGEYFENDYDELLKYYTQSLDQSLSKAGLTRNDVYNAIVRHQSRGASLGNNDPVQLRRAHRETQKDNTELTPKDREVYEWIKSSGRWHAGINVISQLIRKKTVPHAYLWKVPEVENDLKEGRVGLGLWKTFLTVVALGAGEATSTGQLIGFGKLGALSGGTVALVALGAGIATPEIIALPKNLKQIAFDISCDGFEHICYAIRRVDPFVGTKEGDCRQIQIRRTDTHLNGPLDGPPSPTADYYSDEFWMDQCDTKFETNLTIRGQLTPGLNPVDQINIEDFSDWDAFEDKYEKTFIGFKPELNLARKNGYLYDLDLEIHAHGVYEDEYYADEYYAEKTYSRKYVNYDAAFLVGATETAPSDERNLDSIFYQDAFRVQEYIAFAYSEIAEKNNQAFIHNDEQLIKPYEGDEDALEVGSPEDLPLITGGIEQVKIKLQARRGEFFQQESWETGEGSFKYLYQAEPMPIDYELKLVPQFKSSAGYEIIENAGYEITSERAEDEIHNITGYIENLNSPRGIYEDGRWNESNFKSWPECNSFYFTDNIWKGDYITANPGEISIYGSLTLPSGNTYKQEMKMATDEFKKTLIIGPIPIAEEVKYSQYGNTLDYIDYTLEIPGSSIKQVDGEDGNYGDHGLDTFTTTTAYYFFREINSVC